MSGTLQQITDNLKEVSSKVAALEAAMAAQMASSRQATAEMQALRGDVAEMLGAFESARGAYKTLEMLGKIAKPLMLLVALSAFVTLAAENVYNWWRK